MSGKKKSKTSWPPKLFLGNDGSPNQSELKVIANAIHAALEYSPLGSAPEHHLDVYAQVARRVEERFWTDIYVDRPEIREIIFTLDTGLLTLITGERGTGKSTAIRAVIHELTGSTELEAGIDPRSRTPNLIPYIFDANHFTEGMTDEQMVADKIHEHMFAFLDSQIRDRSAWLSYLYEKSQSFYELHLALDRANVAPQTPLEWTYFGEQDRYSKLVDAGMAKFAETPFSDRLRFLLGFIGKRTTYEPLLIIDNVDHLDHDLVLKCGLVLGAISQSSSHRVRAAMALRSETAEAIQWRLDTLPQPHPISMMQRSLSAGQDEDAAVWVTLEFLEKRLAVLKDPDIVELMRGAIDKKKASKLAADFNERSVGVFLDHVMELLDLMIFDVFRTNEADKDVQKENFELAHAVHAWHNGSLRECGLSLTKFASEILQNKDHMTRLRGLLESAEEVRGHDLNFRRSRLRRISRSLLYRHLLLWAARPDAERPQPLENVMVFDGNEESTTPPIHFLRLRILQYLAHRRKGRVTVATIREDLGQLDLKERRIDEALRDLSVKRTQDDAGLIRIDGRSRDELGEELNAEASIQLLDAGKFLAERLYVTTEYLFWSALYTKAASQATKIPRKVTPEQLQDDAFRATVATRFLEQYLVQRFTDEHPYLLQFDDYWTPERARDRLKLYERLFGFSPQNWFLSHAAKSVRAFIPPRDPDDEWKEAQMSIDRIQELARSLDELREATVAPQRADAIGSASDV